MAFGTSLGFQTIAQTGFIPRASEIMREPDGYYW